MILNFIPWFNTETTLKIIDCSSPNSKEIIDIMYSIKVSVTSDKLPNGGLYNVDAIPYIVSFKRNAELYEFSTADFGLPIGTSFNDGVYTVLLNINNNIEKLKKVVKYSIIKDKVETLLKKVSLDFDITKYQITYKSNTTKSNQDLAMSCLVLLNNIYALAQVPDEAEINTNLDKLNKLLLITENEYGKSDLY